MNSTSTDFTPLQFRCLALGAAAQCALLVYELATHGQVNPRQLRACVAPLLVLDPDSVGVLFPDPGAFSEGLKAVQQTLSGESNRNNADAVRYLLGITVLQKKLMKLPRLQEQVRSGLQQAVIVQQNAARDGLDELADFPFDEIAALYQKSISPLSYRIHVAGNPMHLREKRVADQIRTLLLAGIRFAVLWQQMGGRRWHLLVYRKSIRDTISGIRRNLLTISTIH